MLEMVKRLGIEVSNSTIKYRYNAELGVFERADVNTDNWTQFCVVGVFKEHFLN